MALAQEKQLLCKDFLAKPKRMLIDGKWVEAESGKTFETRNPATDEVLAKIPEASKADVDNAVKAARKAFEEGPWHRMSASERGRCLYKLADLVEQCHDELSQLETLDSGKPIVEARTDVPEVANTLRYYAGWATKIEGETINANSNFFTYTLREPIGVVGQIIPWNFPMCMLAWKFGPALATGNTIVLKPAEQTPLSALFIGELVEKAGFPAGVINIITGMGANSTGEFLANHMDVDKIAFTGEYKTGQEIVKASAGNLKRVSLELGGKGPNIVFADINNMDEAVKVAFDAIFYNQGQVCCAGSRLFLEKPIHDQFVAKLIDLVSKMRQGPGIDENTTIGPQVSREQQERILNYIDIAKKEGAKLVCGGDTLKGDLAKGYYVKPTIFTNVNNNMRIAQEEVFGPVLAVIPFSSTEEVAQLANKTMYGLSAAVWTNDIKKAHKLAKQIKSGVVWINCFNAFDPSVPFGGYKMSGYGRELGKHSLDLYTNIKSVWVNLAD